MNLYVFKDPYAELPYQVNSQQCIEVDVGQYKVSEDNNYRMIISIKFSNNIDSNTFFDINSFRNASVPNWITWSSNSYFTVYNNFRVGGVC